MFVYDKTFDQKVVLGHCDLITWFSDFAFYLGFLLVYEHNSFPIMFAYDKTFDPKVFLGHCDLIYASVTLPYIMTFGLFSYVFIIMSKYDKTFVPNVLYL